MKEFYVCSKYAPLVTDPSSEESDATMIFWKCCDKADKDCPAIQHFKALGATYYAPKVYSSVKRYCFNFAPNKMSIDTLRKVCDEARIICLYCERGIERRG